MFLGAGVDIEDMCMYVCMYIYIRVNALKIFLDAAVDIEGMCMHVCMHACMHVYVSMH